MLRGIENTIKMMGVFLLTYLPASAVYKINVGTALERINAENPDYYCSGGLGVIYEDNYGIGEDSHRTIERLSIDYQNQIQTLLFNNFRVISGAQSDLDALHSLSSTRSTIKRPLKYYSFLLIPESLQYTERNTYFNMDEVVHLSFERALQIGFKLIVLELSAESPPPVVYSPSIVYSSSRESYNESTPIFYPYKAPPKKEKCCCILQ